MENKVKDCADDLAGFVLAGGASSRMGRDKAQLQFGTTTLVERAANVLDSVTTVPVSIVGNLSVGDFTDELAGNFSWLRDDLTTETQQQRRGAIVGLHTVFKNSKTAWAAILACDLPFAGAEIFDFLATQRTAEFDAIVPIQPDGRWQPLVALYRSQACLPQIEKMLGENVWSVKELLSRVRTRPVKFAEISNLPNADYMFLNVNTPTDYQIALKIELENRV